MKQHVDTVLLKYTQNFFGYVWILPGDELGSVFNYGDSASEPSHCLCEFEPHETSAQHDQMLRHAIQFEHLDVSHRLGGLQTRHIGNSRTGAKVQKNLITRKHTGGPVS